MDFTQILPYDVLCQIFSHQHFSNEDYLAFINVSKSWQDAVPNYSLDSWRDIFFSLETWETTTTLKLACYLGSHVQRVHIDNFVERKYKLDSGRFVTVSNVLEVLVRTGCLNIQCLVFQRCLFDINSNVLGLLRTLSVDLVELAFLQHRTNMPFIATIASCPKLVQFSYSIDNGFRGIHYADICTDEPSPESNHSNRKNETGFSAMTCLSIDATLAHRQRLGPILSKCPNLAVLRLNNSYVTPPFDLLLSGQLDLNMRDIFVWCPKLEYLACNSPPSNPRPDVEGWMSRYRKDKRTKEEITSSNCQRKARRLHTLIYCEGRQEEYQTVLEQIKDHETSLEALTISAGVSDARMNWDALETVNALHLRKLKLDGIMCSEQSIATFIDHCHALEVIFLRTRRTADYTYQSVFHALRPLSKLKGLTINYQFIDQLRRQELRTDDVLRPLCDWLDFLAARHRTTDGSIAFQELHVIGSVGLNILHDRLLDSLCSVTMLKALELNNAYHPDVRFHNTFNHENLSTEEMWNILQKLSYLSVEKLFLVKVAPFCKELFDILSSIKHLRVLELVSSSGSYHIDDLVDFIKSFIPFNTVIMRDRHDRRIQWKKLVDYIEQDCNDQYTITVDKVFPTWCYFEIHRRTYVK